MSETFMLSTMAQDAFILIALAVALFLITNSELPISFGGQLRDLGLIAAAMFVWGGYHVVHLIFLILGQIWAGDVEILRIAAFLQIHIRWIVELVATLLLLTGLVRMIRKRGQLRQELRATSTTLERGMQVRQSLESELKNASQSQKVKTQNESEFLLALSHELRTPLNGIIGLGSLLGNTELDHNQRRLLATLEQSAQTMLSRVSAVVELSRLRTENVEVRSVVFSPAELARSIEALFSLSATEKGLALTNESTQAAQAAAIGDSLLTKQLLSTLISLAIKHSTAGSIHLLVDLETAGEEMVWVQFTASASGLCFPPEVVEHVKADLGSTRGEGGLGLAICWRLAKLMEGQLAIESDPAAGTVVTVRLPMRREP